MYFKSILNWVLSIGSVIFMFMVFFPTFAADTAFMEQILAHYPEELLKAFGMDTELSLSTVLGYFSFTFVFVQLLLAIQSANYGFHFLSVEERELTADFLMSKPVSRQKILVSKFLAAFTSLTITNTFVWILSFAAIELFNNGAQYDAGHLITLLLTNTLFQIFFLSFGNVISVSIQRIGSVLSYSLGFTFGLYLLNTFQSILGGELVGYLTPFYHFDPSYILKHNSLNWSYAFISISLSAAALGITYYRYLRRDIHSV